MYNKHIHQSTKDKKYNITDMIQTWMCTLLWIGNETFHNNHLHITNRWLFILWKESNWMYTKDCCHHFNSTKVTTNMEKLINATYNINLLKIMPSFNCNHFNILYYRSVQYITCSYFYVLGSSFVTCLIYMDITLIQQRIFV